MKLVAKIRVESKQYMTSFWSVMLMKSKDIAVQPALLILFSKPLLCLVFKVFYHRGELLTFLMLLFFSFSGNRGAVCCRSSIFEAAMGFHQFDSVQHHWWNVGRCDIDCCCGTGAQHHPLTGHRWLPFHHLHYWRQCSSACSSAEESHQSADCAVHSLPWVVPPELGVLSVDFVFVEAWHAARTGGGGSYKAFITWNAHFWVRRKNDLTQLITVITWNDNRPEVSPVRRPKTV